MSTPGTSSTRAAVLGALAGLVAGGMILAALDVAYLRYAVVRARRGWNLVPVVVAAVDIPEGTVVTLDMVSQRQVPEQFVTSSVVRPESASHIVNQKILVPVQAGDPLLWTQFETLAQPKVLVAAVDIPARAVIAEGQVAERPMPKDLLTESYVLTKDRPQVIGRTVAAPFRRGDPILWTHFQAPGSSGLGGR
ncbi:MAG TPA: SAF domain-containing protein [Myxococcaceae bacterium]|nr:SAF domain-containing protein [Myxococcaceae bacterium]